MKPALYLVRLVYLEISQDDLLVAADLSGSCGNLISLIYIRSNYGTCNAHPTPRAWREAWIRSASIELVRQS